MFIVFIELYQKCVHHSSFQNPPITAGWATSSPHKNLPAVTHILLSRPTHKVKSDIAILFECLPRKIQSITTQVISCDF